MVDNYAPARPGRSLGPKTVTGWLLAINIAVFILDRALMGMGIGYLVRVPGAPGLVQMGVFEYWGHFSAAKAILGFEVWRFIGFQFLHANLTHILFNMFMLYMFGRTIEGYLGPRRFVVFYLLCGIAGPVAYCVLWATGWFVSTPYTPLVGASAGVFGVLIATATLAPKAQVLVFGLFPAQLRDVAFVMIGVAVYTILFFGDTGHHNAGGEAAHLGGALAGYLLIRRPKLLDRIAGVRAA